ncbi:MAG: glycohydrolase toxin TNT-related protein, partial [Leadbetterella sp.]
TYAWGTNKLQKIDDEADANLGFKNINQYAEYGYNAQGDMVQDNNKDISLIEYNYLGLIDKVHFGAYKYIENFYTSDGQKLRMKYTNGSTTLTKDYVGDLIYINDTLRSIWHDEGRITYDNAGKPTYQFFINDHQGSTRVVFQRLNTSTYIAQRIDYGVTGDIITENTGQNLLTHLYQGKEWMDGFGYDFVTRTYDPYTLRMLQVDGANQFASGYTGMGNNPILGVDPDGQAVHVVAGAIIGGFINLGIKAYQGKINSFKDGAVAFGIGAVAGAVTAATGGAALAATGLSGTTVLGGALAGGVGSATGGAIQGIGNSAYFGDKYTAKDWAVGTAVGIVSGGVFGGIAGKLKGAKGGDVWGRIPRKSPYQSVHVKGRRVEFGELGFEGADDVILNAEGVALRGEVPVYGSTSTFAGQTAGKAIVPFNPINGGALGSWTSKVLPKGTIIDRYGSEFGNYFSPKGTPLNMRSLSYNPNGPPTTYEVIKSLPIQESVISPAFGKVGLGIQYKSSVSVSDLLRLNYIRIVR